MAARGLLVLHEWPVWIGHEGAARVVYISNLKPRVQPVDRKQSHRIYNVFV